ncbi:MAG: aminotransferase class III-fold pyridoxal phosphate-dependent enzyme, partial [Pseudonocardiales bacterium]|nr:aminotransferase class III-fold pyridoxal phosphate-dependent enzyme [Pseudonocardiales bacterium]
MTLIETATERHERLVHEHSAHNYHPLPVVVSHARGAWVTDVEGRHHLDCLAGYSALNFGHGHPALLAAAHDQLDRVTLTSRAFGSDRLGPFCAALAGLVGKDRVLPMNTGAEAVESGIKVARKWGYEVRGVPEDRARIVVMDGGFHGRTTTIVGFSTDPDARGGFGPFTPGFDVVPYGPDDPTADAVRAAIGPDTVAVLLEPVQGEAGVVVPPPGYLAAVRAACDEAGVLMVADEVQSGLGRTGHVLATRGA